MFSAAQPVAALTMIVQNKVPNDLALGFVAGMADTGASNQLLASCSRLTAEGQNLDAEGQSEHAKRRLVNAD
jgi:hypothetical protein